MFGIQAAMVPYLNRLQTHYQACILQKSSLFLLFPFVLQLDQILMRKNLSFIVKKMDSLI